MTISYPVRDHLELARDLAAQLGAQWKGNHFDMPADLGEGLVEAYSYEGFSTTFSRFRMKREVKIERVYNEIKGQLVLGFILKGATRKFFTPSNRRLGQLYCGTYISTPSTQSFGIFKQDEWYEQVSMLIDSQWLRRYLQSELPEILWQPDSPLFIVLEIPDLVASGFRKLITGDHRAPLRRKAVELQCLLSIVQTVQRLGEKGRSYEQKKHHPEDINRILEIAEYIDENLDEHVPISRLSGLFGMNKDKLQGLFKSVFGYTVADFARNKRMTRAYELIEEGHTVSEVGRGVGYTNLSHFSRAFRSIYGYNPSELLRGK